jgi:hypothetical protein
MIQIKLPHRKKYHNILACKDDFQAMLAACDLAEQNLSGMQSALQ